MVEYFYRAFSNHSSTKIFFFPLNFNVPVKIAVHSSVHDR